MEENRLGVTAKLAKGALAIENQQNVMHPGYIYYQILCFE